MRPSSYFLAFLAGFLSFSCNREEAREPTAKEECTVHFTLEREAHTKSILPSDIENRLDNAFVLLSSEDGYFRYQYFDFTSASQGPSVEWRLPAGMDYTVYALGNMGNVLPSLPRTETGFDMAAFRFEVPPYGSLRAMPMARQLSLPSSRLREGENVSLSISLQRLMAKVCVSIDKSGITGGEAAQAMQSGSLHLRQVARAIYPFRADGSRALSAEDIYPGNTDYYNFSAAEAWNLGSGEITLYLPENRQGTGTGSTQPGKVPTGSAAGRANLATYLEYTAAKSGTHDGVAGNMTYRVYLGENETNNFDVIGDKVYSATLSLSWNGMWEGTWRVAKSDWADNRELVISRTANGKSPMGTSNTKAGSEKVRKGTPTAFYLNFFPAGTDGSVAHGRKDLGSWPYGFQVLVDGTALGSGTSGTIKNASNQDLIAWSYNATNDCLSMETIPGSPASADIHTLQLRTLDGRKESPTEYFTTSIPFEFRWNGDLSPNHVAQKNIISAVDADTHLVDATGVFHLKSAYADYISLTDNHNGTATVSLLKPFSLLEGDSSPIYIEDADGDRHCDVPLESRLPHAACSDFWTTYVDASVNLKYTYLSSVDNGTDSDVAGDPMIVTSDAGVIHCGQYLDYDLANSLIKPVLTSTNGKLGSELSLGEDGCFQLKTYIATYNGLVPSGTNFNVDIAKVEMYNHASRDLKTGMVYNVWNPWKNIQSIEHSTTVYDDYTLFKRPVSGSPYWGWAVNPADAPKETKDDVVLSLQNPVVLNEANVKFNTVWATAQNYFLGDIATGAPGKCAADFNADKWTLWMDVLNHAHFDKERVYNYLFGRGLYFVDVNDMVDYLTASDWRIAVGSAFFSEADAYNNTPSPTTPDTGGERAYGVQGVQFTAQRNSDFSTWTFTYGMKGRTAENLKTHNAGKFNVVLQVVNPYDPTGTRLSQVVADAYMRLHVYVLSKMTAGPELSRKSGPGAPEDYYWTFGCTPITTTSDYIPSLSSFLEGREILQPSAEVNSSISVAFYSGSPSATIHINSGANMFFSFRDKEAFNSMSQTDAKISLRNGVNSYGTNPFTLANSSTLTSNLGAGTFFRENGFKLYYDPSGETCTYTYPVTDRPEYRYQLFVIHLFDGAGVIDRGAYYFDSSWNL